MTTKIFIGNLSDQSTVEEVRGLFEQFGNVVECDIVKHFGFVHMEVEDEARTAIDALSGYNLNGQQMNVELSTGKNLHGRRRADNPSAPPFGGRGRGRRPDGRPQPYGRGGRGGVRGGRGGHNSYDNGNGYESFDRDAMYDELYNEVYRDAYMQAYKDLCREMASREVAAEARKAVQAGPPAAAGGEPYRRPPPEYYEQGSSSRPMISSRPGPEAVPVKYPGLESSYSSGYPTTAAPRYAAPRGPPMRPPMMRGGYHM